MMKPCDACGAPIVFDTTKNGKLTPRNASDGKPHWATCTRPRDFRKPATRTPRAPTMREARQPAGIQREMEL